VPALFAQGLGNEWTGPGGVGDYADANGNTADVLNAAHQIRDGAYHGALPVGNVEDSYDLVVVGGGLAGMAAAHALHMKSGSTRHCLVLENHAMFGGESRGNLVEVDGYLLAGPQGANLTGNHVSGHLGEIHRELGLPTEYDFAQAERTASALRIPDDHFDALLKRRSVASTGYYVGTGRGWLRGELEQLIDRLPWPESERRGLAQWFKDRVARSRAGLSGSSLDESRLALGDEPTEDTPVGRWLDTMSYGYFIRREMRLDSGGIAKLLDPYLLTTLGGSVDGVSAYGARVLDMPGVSGAAWRWPTPGASPDSVFSFPMGNAIYPRCFVRAMLPKAYADGSFLTMAYGRTRLEELDRPSNTTRIRLGATVIRVEHERGDTSGRVLVTYVQRGELHRVAASGVVMACGGWVNRRIVHGMPDELRAAFQSFHYAPVLVANVAVRHWRYLDELGISAARWFEGFGFATNLRRPMRVDGKAEPLSPDKPTVLTFYAPLTTPGVPVPVGTAEGRQLLFATSFAGFETQIRRQMQEMFGHHGFDAKRDIAAIVLNRWGHAFSVPEPGFYFGSAGARPARDVVRAGFGRIAFGCAEYQGYQTWHGAIQEGRRAAAQAS
jgi:spermidine dehydrogenase